MADMYDIAYGAPRLGVAFPIANDSFRYWDSSGDPLAWTEVTATATEDTDAYDGDARAMNFLAITPPNDNTVHVKSDPQIFTNTGYSALYCYMVWAAYAGTLTDSGLFRLILETDATSAMSSPNSTSLYTLSSTDSVYTLYTSVVALTISLADLWSRVKIVGRTATGVGIVNGYSDNVGIMYSPVNNAAGYYQLPIPLDEAVMATAGRYSQDTESRLGTTTRFDPSGGAKKWRIRYTFRDEPLSFYEAMQTFHDLNHGRPGEPGLPLGLQPRLPGVPPYVMCNIVEASNPIQADPSKVDSYGGTVTFEAVYA